MLASTSISAISFAGSGSTSVPLILPPEIESILDDIQRAIEAQLYYPALVVTLTLPEICCSLALDNNVFIKEKHYTEFVDRYTTPATLGLDGLGCYRLRGGVIHRGNAAGHPFFGSTHVIFTVPETGASIHALSIVAGEKRSAMFDLISFCRAMEGAVRKWYADHQDDPKVTTNIANLLSWRPNGIKPFLRGSPVVGCGPE